MSTDDRDLDTKVERFRSLGREMRLQMLLQYAKRFPELPRELQAARDRGLNRVEECQTPLFLWVGVEDDRVKIHADAPGEAPTVRGFMSFLMEALDGAGPEEVADLPADLLERMGLTEALGIVRIRGLSSVVERIKRDVARAAHPGSRAPSPGARPG